MQDAVGVEVGQSRGHIQAEVELYVEGQGVWCHGLQEMCEAVVHELHEQNRQSRAFICVCAQVLDDVGVLEGSQELTLLLKPVHHGPDPGVSQVKENRVG